MGGDLLDSAGIWTLTVKPGTFELECRPISDQGEDCGHNPLTKTHPFLVEIGQLRGDRATVWFLDHGALKAKLTGCDPHSECGAAATYRSPGSDGLGTAFSDLRARSPRRSGPVTNWTAKPWTKIA
jgi:hypothetical protein